MKKFSRSVKIQLGARLIGVLFSVITGNLIALALFLFAPVLTPMQLFLGDVPPELTADEQRKADAFMTKVKEEVKKELDLQIKVVKEGGEKSYKEILDKRLKPLEEMPIEKLKAYSQEYEAINKAISDLKGRKTLARVKEGKETPFIQRKLKNVYPALMKAHQDGASRFRFSLDGVKKMKTDVDTAGKKVNTTSYGTDVVRGFREAGIDFENLPELFILDQIRTMTGGKGSNPLSWVERNVAAIGGVGAKLVSTLNPTSVAEEAAKPQGGFEWVARQEMSVTIAEIVPVTKQAVFNYPELEGEIRFELLRRLAMILQQQIINGDGTANTLKGINYYAKAFAAPGELALGVDRANQFDVLVAAATQIMEKGFIPNLALVSSITNAQMTLLKDPTTGMYILPPFSTPNGLQVYGMQVKPTLDMPTDQFIVGDKTKSLFNWVEGITIEVGMINDDFQKNIWRIRGELQGVHRIKSHEAFAFVKGDMSVAKAALETI